MKTYTETKVYVGQPGTSMTTLYTVSNGLIVKEILLVNTTASAETVDIHFVPSGGTADNTNKVIPTYSVPANDCLPIPLSTFLEASDAIEALQATSGAITVHISGVEVSQ